MKQARTLIALCLLLTGISLFDQLESQRLMKVNIPFAFTAAERSLPAGQYLVFTVT